MNDLETYTELIINLYNTYRSRMNNYNHHGAVMYRTHYPKTLDSKKIYDVLLKIEKNGGLDLINANSLNIACLIHHYYDDFYDILEYMFNKDNFKKKNKFSYYLIRLNILNVVEDRFHYYDAKDKNIDIDSYFLDELAMKKYLLNYEKNIPINLKGKYGIEVANMTKLLIIMYYDYDNSLNNLNDFLLNFLFEYQDEMKLNGINSWFLGKEHRKEYIDFLEHYLNNSLNSKKMIK